MSEQIIMVSIEGMKVGLIGLEGAIEQVKEMNLADDEEIKAQLLEKVKAQNYVPSSREEDYARALLRQYKKTLGIPIEEEVPAGLEILVLGPGCYACDKLMEDMKAMLAELNIAVNLKHVRDKKEIGRFGVVGTPALVINRKVVLVGRTLLRNQLKKLIEEKLKFFS